MSSVDKGNKLEDAIYDYLRSQQGCEGLVLGLYPPDKCTIEKKAKRYCKEREANVEFDILIEVRRTATSHPHLHIVFECKNHADSIPENAITDLDSKLNRVFRHNSKGILVHTSRLQKGAWNLAKNSGIGVAKFDPTGLEIQLDRSAEPTHIEHQLKEHSSSKPFMFSAFCDGEYFSSASQLVKYFDSDISTTTKRATSKIPHLSNAELAYRASALLKEIGYSDGPVELETVCKRLNLDLTFSEAIPTNLSGSDILGTANFALREIHIYPHRSPRRQRFTLAHEIAHFYLGHGSYLMSESVIESDLFDTGKATPALNYSRLEKQANRFASYLLLPSDPFQSCVDVARDYFQFVDKGHGYIYVDDQPCNYTPYNQLLSFLSDRFEVSRQVVEIRLKSMSLLTDQRVKPNFTQNIAKYLP